MQQAACELAKTETLTLSGGALTPVCHPGVTRPVRRASLSPFLSRELPPDDPRGNQPVPHGPTAAPRCSVPQGGCQTLRAVRSRSRLVTREACGSEMVQTGQTTEESKRSSLAMWFL